MLSSDVVIDDPLVDTGIAIILDRGWGRAPQVPAGEDGDGDIRVTIRHIVEGRDAPRVIDAKTIDATSVRHELESDEETET